MNKHLWHLMLALGWVVSSFAAAAQPEAAFHNANAAYEAGQFQEALEAYEALLQDHRHFESEFNAGNAAFKMGELGRARLHYERAKLLDASNDHLQANMALLESKIVDRITPIPNLGLTTWLSSWIGPGQLPGWVLWALVWWTMSWILWAQRWRKTQPESKATMTFLAAASLLLGLGGLWAVQACNAQMKTPGQLVIMADRVDVTSAPSESGTVLFQLHEGTRACILDRSFGWTEVELDNGNVGWIPMEATEDV